MLSGGIVGYFGFEYQFVSTALIMLQAHRGKNTPSFQLTVETLFGEDAELEQKKRKGLFSRQVEDESILQIQVKTKQETSHWKPADIRDLILKVNEDSDKKDTVLDRLYSEPNQLFVFITDGTVSEDLSGLLASSFGTLQHKYSDHREKARQVILKSDKKGKYKDKLSRLTPEIIRKVFIIANSTIDDIERQIREILLLDYGLPAHQLDEKTRALLDLVRDCARRKNNREVITDQDVTEIIGISGIELPSQKIELLYQKTDEYNIAKILLTEKHLALISGEPGSGKTTLAYKLANDLVNQHYRFELSGETGYLDIVRASKGGENIVFLLDDGFGYDECENYGETLGNNFEHIVSQLQESNGRIKVLVTSRTNIIAQACASTKLTAKFLSKYLVSIPFPNSEFILLVLKAHLKYQKVKPDIVEAILTNYHSFPTFEDLNHVQAFSRDLVDFEEPLSKKTLLSVFEATKPSLYLKWIEKQTINIRLFLLTLWLVSEINQIVTESDNKLIFNSLSKCVDISPTKGLSTPYDQALRDLQTRDRVILRRGSVIDFFHPVLRQATAQYFNSIHNKRDFVICNVDILINLDNPLAQSIGIYLALNILDNTDKLEKLAVVTKSKYIQVIDTFIQFGKSLLECGNQKLEQLAASVYSTHFHPSECTIDDRGYIVIRKGTIADDNHTYSASDLVEMTMWEDIGFISDNEPELAEKFQKHLIEQNYFLLNPLEKYKFIDWSFAKYQDGDIVLAELLSVIENLSTDPISFVRQRVAEHIWKIIEKPESQTILETLCYDGSPFVKIAILEDAILRTWSKQNSKTQQLWLELAASMLDDAIVRHHCSRGLIDQSGSLYFYHEEHTEEQKREWFKAVAKKLLVYRLRFDDFSRYLTAMQKNYPNFSKGYKVELLLGIQNYITQNKDQSHNIIYDVEKIALSEETSTEENNILINLISQLPSIAKSDLLFRLTKNNEHLSDERYIETLYRPFFIESNSEYILERSAVLLGFLATETNDLENLPEPVKIFSENGHEAIRKYVDSQPDEFKLAMVFQSLGYENFYGHASHSEKMLLHPIVLEQLNNFLFTKNTFRTFVTNALLGNGYSLARGKKTWWYDCVEQIFSIEDIDFQKSVLEMLFSYNVGSSLHDFYDWARFLASFLTHPNPEIKTFAFSLFDKYYYEILRDFFFSPHPNTEEYNQFKKVWLDETFFSELMANAPSAKNYLEFLGVLSWLKNSWDEFSDEQKHKFLKELSEKAVGYEINQEISNFMEDMGDNLTKSEQALLEKTVKLDRGTAPISIEGSKEYFKKRSSIRKLEPRFDWGMLVGDEYFSSFDSDDEFDV